MLSRRASLLEQVPTLAGQELANGRDGPPAPGGLRRLEGPSDRQALTLPAVVIDVACSPDGTRLVTTGGMFEGLLVWRLPGPEPEVCLLGHRAGVAEARFLPDGDRVLSAGWDGHVILWDVRTAGLLVDFHAHDDVVNAVAVAGDGRLAVSGGWDGKVVLYDLVDRVVTGVQCEDRGQVNSLRLSPDGRRLLGASGDGRVGLWDVPGRRLLRSWQVGGGGLLNCVDVDWPTGRALACSLAGHLHLLALGSDAPVVTTRIDEVPLERVVILPGADRAVTGDGAGRLRLWRLPDLQAAGCVEAHRGRAPAATVLGGQLISGGADHALRGWRLPDLEAVWTHSAGRQHLLRADLRGDGAGWWGIDRGGRLTARPAPANTEEGEMGPAYAVRCGPGDCVVVGSTTGRVGCRDGVGWRWRKRLHRGAVGQLAVSPDGRWLASADLQGELCLTDLATGGARGWLPHSQATAGLAWAPQGDRLFWLGAGRLRALATGSGEPEVLHEGPDEAHELVVLGEVAVVARAMQVWAVEWQKGRASPLPFRFPLGVERLARGRGDDVLALGRDGTVAWLDVGRRRLVGATQVPGLPLAAVLCAAGLAVVDGAGHRYLFAGLE